MQAASSIDHLVHRCRFGLAVRPYGMRNVVTLVLTTSLLASAAQAALPTKVGVCDLTRVMSMEHRLQDRPGHFVPDSGTAIKLGDQGYLVSYDEVPTASDWRRADPVMLCLARIPTNCPAGDVRGRWYTATNLRTMSSLTMPDAEHGCGGA